MKNFGDFCEKALCLRNKYASETFSVYQEGHEGEEDYRSEYGGDFKIGILIQIVSDILEDGEFPSQFSFKFESDGYTTGRDLSLAAQEVLTDLGIPFEPDGYDHHSTTSWASFKVQAPAK